MSYWTYITGVITVAPMGETQPEKRYVLDTVLSHLPVVTGSEGDLKIHVVQKDGYNCSTSHNEFGEPLWYRRTADNDGRMRTQDEYLLVLEADLRDRTYENTLKEKLGVKVSVSENKITIPFDSEGDLNRIFEIFNIDMDEE